MGKYDAWDAYFAGIDEGPVVVEIDRLENMLPGALPTSARRHAAWWASSQPHAVWSRHGLRASPDLRSGTVRFQRASSVARATAPHPPTPPGEPDPDERLVLLGCVARKRSVAAPARDLYVSPLWEKRKAYAEATEQPWAILSAEHGLVMPDEVIEPYDRSLKDEPIPARERWADRTSDAVIALCRRLGVGAVEVHAGSAYLKHGLVAALGRAGLRVYWPLRGKRIGEQLSWYGERLAPDGSRPSPARPAAEALASHEAPPEIIEMRRIGPFEYRWPDSTEEFEHGWEGTVEIDGRTVRFRHGVGQRLVYGAGRVHTVTWIGPDPVVEGVGADDYHRSRGLLSLLKDAGGAMIRDRVPEGYAPLQIVDHRAEIDAPYSRTGLAAKIRVDDVAGWLLHATLRRGGGGRPILPSPRASVPDGQGVEPQPPPFVSKVEALDQRRKRAVAQALVAFGQTAGAQLSSQGGSVEFTEDPEANAFLTSNAFAFLVGVICDQGIKAERAWAIPKELERRLGHLDPYRMVAEPDGVYRVFIEPSSLHRYVNNVPAWLISAADRVITRYGGDAAAIWDDSPTAAELQDRLRAFDGIGQKKAAMAVEMLERDLGVEVREMSGSDVAYDVHIRRVFLRSGLAEIDDVDHMVAVARQIYPERPGALDSPAWVIGRTWCRPANPMCMSCVLSDPCAKRMNAGDSVRNV